MIAVSTIDKSAEIYYCIGASSIVYRLSIYGKFRMMKDLGQFVGFCTPGLLFLGPVLLAVDIDANPLGLIGGIILGFGLVGMFYHLKKK